MATPSAQSAAALVPKQERSRLTQRRIVEAAADLLASGGYDAFSTAAVARAAQVSKGALFQHFPTRDGLVATAVLEVFERQERLFLERFETFDASNPERLVRQILEAVWEIVSSEPYRQNCTVYLSATSKPELAAMLAPVASAGVEEMYEIAEALLREAGVPGDVDVTGLVSVAYYTLEGMACEQLLAPDPVEARLPATLDMLEAMALDLVGTYLTQRR